MLKSKSRSRLGVKTLDALTRLKLNTSDWSDINYAGALQHWMDSSSRGRYFIGANSSQGVEEREDLVDAEALKNDLSGCGF